ncbi:hypothetical protein [Desulfurobacterium sp. TC5-1]|uniref:hypothetical protein n=1 Tax=Desulfurobacterium sp. TC5-1 TaxID=1158318 RepID=UPI0003B750C0|nr:hypothetical protein [Desulfurobacterium sp. TC5-1]
MKTERLTEKDKKLLEKFERMRRIRGSREELYKFLVDNVEKIGKRDVMRDSKALDKKFAIITDRKRVKGFYVDLEAAKLLPAEVQAFFFMLLDASGCKYIVEKD